MMIIRPIRGSDKEAFIEIAFTAGIGMTSMPKNRKILEERIHHTVASFEKAVSDPIDESYLFVLEDSQSHAIGGVCGIIAKTGKHTPLPFYKIHTENSLTGFNSHSQQIPTLRVVFYENYWSEICSLYLYPHFRHGGLGRLLSLSRFLFIATFPERFDKMIFAEMRGHLEEQGRCPFWEGVGRHFVDMTFEELMHKRDERRIDLTKALPQYPIYIKLLPEEVQASIGRVHDHTAPALKMLQQEGFVISKEIDICDGGPKIECATQDIHSVKESRLAKVVNLKKTIQSDQSTLVCNNRLDFRACLSPIELLNDGEVAVPIETAKALDITLGDAVRFLLPKNRSESCEKFVTFASSK